MTRLPAATLDLSTQKALASFQAEVDGYPTYAERVAAAKELFPKKRGHKAFDAVKEALTTLCAGARRCGYCEDSVADEVEHIRPKDLYPAEVFAWLNYLYACGPCNVAKGNRFAIFERGTGRELDITPPRRKPREPPPPVVEPPPGDALFIDPRVEDPAAFLHLDLEDTLAFRPNPLATARDQRRAAYTIDTLGLNARDYLLRARAQALRDIEAHLARYLAERPHAAAPRLDEIRRTITHRAHRCVWKELQRQRGGADPERQRLLAQVPEALSW